MNTNKNIEQDAKFLTAPKKQLTKKPKKKPPALRLVRKVALPKRGEFNFLKTGKW
jgi:hypothetical protein